MAEKFTQLRDFDNTDIQDFTVLLSELSTTFARKEPEAKTAAVAKNLAAALGSSDTFVLVHRDRATRHITASATGNVVLGSEGWVDDVVTLSSQRGHHLGFDSMQALHRQFRERGIGTVRLTSSFERQTAGNLYTNLGYVEGGTVWRNPELHKYVAHDALGSSGTLRAVNCTIPTGNKAWLYGPAPAQTDQPIHSWDIKSAVGELWHRGVSVNSINYFDTGPLEELNPQLRDVLQTTGFIQRATRLYTLDLASIEG